MAVLAKVERKLKDGRALVLRSGIPDDAAELLAITAAVIAESEYVVTTPEELSLTEDQERAFIEAHAAHPLRMVVVAEVDRRIVGFLHFQNSQRARLAHTGRLHMLIRRDWRNHGVGSTLLGVLLSWAEGQEGLEKVALSVFSNNRLGNALYEKFGFIEEGRRVAEIKLGDGEYVDELLMYRRVGCGVTPPAVPS
jgi:RimJ/RimL family protein N-acetyltransferase